MRGKAADDTRSSVSTAPAGADESRRSAWTRLSGRALGLTTKIIETGGLMALTLALDAQGEDRRVTRGRFGLKVRSLVFVCGSKSGVGRKLPGQQCSSNESKEYQVLEHRV